MRIGFSYLICIASFSFCSPLSDVPPPPIYTKHHIVIICLLRSLAIDRQCNINYSLLPRFSQQTLLGLDTLFRLCAVRVDICCCWWLCYVLVPQFPHLCGDCRILSSVHRSHARCSSILPEPCQSVHCRNEVFFAYNLSFFLFIGK